MQDRAHNKELNFECCKRSEMVLKKVLEKKRRRYHVSASQRNFSVAAVFIHVNCIACIRTFISQAQLEGSKDDVRQNRARDNFFLTCEFVTRILQSTEIFRAMNLFNFFTRPQQCKKCNLKDPKVLLHT